MNETEPIFTIGHSNHPLWRFVELLQAHAIQTVVDVRSVPYSRRYPAYNRESLHRELKSHGVGYVFLGAELGARPSDPSCYVGQRVSYEKIAETRRFRAGLERAIELARTQRLTILCAEKEPLDCHRALLVSRQLNARGVLVAHILADASLETQEAAENRLLDEEGMRQMGLFESNQDLLSKAYARREERRAFTQSNDGDNNGEAGVT
jgi:uncharacterized protein (DUF488 family)